VDNFSGPVASWGRVVPFQYRWKGIGMTRFEVDSTQVTAASASVASSAQQIGSEVDRMMRQLLALQAGWQGQAATSFQHVVDEWRATQEKVRASLEEIHAALAVAGRQYAEVEASAVRMFAG
jgi:WXG100 family type VII secretion target